MTRRIASSRRTTPRRSSTLSLVAATVLSVLAVPVPAAAEPSPACGALDGGVHVVTNAAELAAIGSGGAGTGECGLGASYALAVAIDLQTLDPDIGDEQPALWTPIGDATAPFTGTIDGHHYSIDGLAITAAADSANIGLIGVAQGATLRDLVLQDVSVDGGEHVGALVGLATDGTTITGTVTTGTVTGRMTDTGGIAGRVDASTVTESASLADIESWGTAGGAVGALVNGSSISRSGTVGDVIGRDTASIVGGFVGALTDSSTVHTSLTWGPVTGDGVAGGFVGRMSDTAQVEDSSSTGDVVGNTAGGFVGTMTASAAIDTTFTTADVTGTGTSPEVGGFIGHHAAPGSADVSDSLFEYSTAPAPDAAGNAASITGVQARLPLLMRVYDTYDATWPIVRGWRDAPSPVETWGWCLGVNDNLPFQQWLFADNDPCDPHPCGEIVDGAHQVSTAEQFAQVGRGGDDIAEECNLGASYDLRDDIDVHDLDADIHPGGSFAWTGIGTDRPFRGNFDGHGHTVQGLVDSSGVFDTIVAPAVVKRVRVAASSINGPTGALARRATAATGTLAISQITVSNSVEVTQDTDDPIAGVVAEVDAGPGTSITLDLVTSSAVLMGGDAVGGVVGRSVVGDHATVSITNAEVAASLVASSGTGGGVVGISRTVADGSVLQVLSTNVTGAMGAKSGGGGMIGTAEIAGVGSHVTVADGRSTATVAGTTSQGGVVGRVTLGGDGSYLALTRLVRRGDTFGSSSSETTLVGGIVGDAVVSGDSQLLISELRSSGTVNGQSSIGGVVGALSADPSADISIGNLHVSAAVTGLDTDSGGVIGATGPLPVGALYNTLVSGEVSGPGSTGAFIGAELDIAPTDGGDPPPSGDLIAVAGVVRSDIGIPDVGEPARDLPYVLSADDDALRSIDTYTAIGWSILDHWIDPPNSSFEPWGICADANRGLPFVQSIEFRSDPCRPTACGTLVDGVYAVATAEQLAAVGSGGPDDPCNLRDSYRLTRPIDVQDLDPDRGDTEPFRWVPIGIDQSSDGFTGTFDGGSFAISGLYGDGLFAMIAGGARVHDVHLEDVLDPDSDGNSGALADAIVNLNDGDIVIKGVDVSGHISGLLTGAVAGIIGATNSTSIEISDVRSSAVVDGTSAGGLIGGIVAADGGRVLVSDVTVDGPVSAEGFAGGVSAQFVSISGGGFDIARADVAADVSSNGQVAGGLLGIDLSITPTITTIADSHYDGAVKSSGIAGGFIGALVRFAGSSLEVTRSTRSGDVTAPSTVGGIVGISLNLESTDKFVDVYHQVRSSGTVTGEGGVGGIVGGSVGGTTAMIDVHVSADVTGTSLTPVSSTIGSSSGRRAPTEPPSAWPSLTDITRSALTSANATLGVAPRSTGADIGGLIGATEYSANYVWRALVTGTVTGVANVGTIAGFAVGDPEVTDTFVEADAGVPDVGSSPDNDLPGVTAATDAELRNIATYTAAEWPIVPRWVPTSPPTSTASTPAADAAGVWGICSRANDGLPFLHIEHASDPCAPPVVVRPSDGNLTYVGDLVGARRWPMRLGISVAPSAPSATGKTRSCTGDVTYTITPSPFGQGRRYVTTANVDDTPVIAPTRRGAFAVTARYRGDGRCGSSTTTAVVVVGRAAQLTTGHGRYRADGRRIRFSHDVSGTVTTNARGATTITHRGQVSWRVGHTWRFRGHVSSTAVFDVDGTWMSGSPRPGVITHRCSNDAASRCAVMSARGVLERQRGDDWVPATGTQDRVRAIVTLVDGGIDANCERESSCARDALGIRFVGVDITGLPVGDPRPIAPGGDLVIL